MVLFDTKIYLVYFNCILTIGASLEWIFVGNCCWDEDWFWDWVVEEFYCVDTLLLGVEFEFIDDELDTLLKFGETVELMKLDELFPEFVAFEDIVEFPVFEIFEEFEVTTWACVWLLKLDVTGVLLFLIKFDWLELEAAVDEFDTVEVFETVEEFNWFIIVLFELFVLDEELLIYFISEIKISRILTS